jgi:hypothetical protein
MPDLRNAGHREICCEIVDSAYSFTVVSGRVADRRFRNRTGKSPGLTFW